uniref:Retrotransposon protein, putative, unclassified n=1 Tax=Oryza sativa subsp. japonica TaxID=39947 RepID=Q2QPP0_ORYSJ|nr:retrotransposon protein, putative, unclassified [Oryza sativa Japonica Group]
MPEVVEVWPTGARARRDGRPNNSGEAAGEVRGDVRRLPGETEGWTRWRATPPRKGEMAAPADAWAWRKGQPGEMPPRRKEKPARATVFRRSSGEEEVMPGMRAASWSRGRWWRRRPALRGRGRGGRRRRSGGDATGRRRGRVSGAFPAKRRADRGRGGSCDAGRGGGAAGGCTGEAGGAAGGGRLGEKRRATAGRQLRRSPRETEDGIFSAPDFSLVAPLADFDWIVALEDGTSVPELLIIHIFGVNLIQVTHFTLCVDISLSLLGYHVCHHLAFKVFLYTFNPDVFFSNFSYQSPFDLLPCPVGY